MTMFGVRSSMSSPAFRRIEEAGRRFLAGEAATVATGPGRQPHPRFWTDEEKEILRKMASAGMSKLMRFIPGRSRGAINQQAAQMGVRVKIVRRKGYKVMAMRGRIEVPTHVHPFVRRLFEAMNDRKMTFDDVERRAGLGFGTVRGWRSSMPQVDTLISALNVVGLDLRLVERNKPIEPVIVADGSLMEIVRRAAWLHGATPEQVVSHCRTPLAALIARDEACWLARRYLVAPFGDIGRHLGKRDQSSIRTAVRRHQARIDALRAKRRGG